MWHWGTNGKRSNSDRIVRQLIEAEEFMIAEAAYRLHGAEHPKVGIATPTGLEHCRTDRDVLDLTLIGTSHASLLASVANAA